jgi:hypothetical protein
MYNLSCIEGFNDLLKSDFNCYSNPLKLNKIQCRINNYNYKVITYDKTILSSDLISSYGLCRSIIVNSCNNIVSFAPPKSISADKFIQKYLDINENIVAEEFIEGTMINVFFDKSIGITGSWEISTRNTVGATSSFYKSKKCKTFRQMFMDAVNECNLDITKLDKKYSYSFVLQHPENRIVIPFSVPNLYLVGVYEIIDNFNIKFYDVKEFHNFFYDLKTTVRFPMTYNFELYSELIDKYCAMNTSYDIVGVIIHNKETGERTKIRNPVYEQVKSLRGNQPKLQYQYLCLRKEGRVKQHLQFYPENKSQFSDFRDQIHLFTETLYNNYIECYIKKQKPLNEYPHEYKCHMFNIHKYYMNELREKKQFITNTFVKKYINDLHPSLLMYCLNYQLRKNNIDKIIADNNI